MAGSKAWKSSWGIIDWKYDQEEVVLQKVEQLLASGAGKYINARDRSGNTVLIRSTEKGFERVVERLLLVSGIDVNAMNRYNLSALTEAAHKGYIGIIEKLLVLPNIDINAGGPHKVTALMMAVMYKQREVVKKLLAFPKINIRIKNWHGDTALDMARWYPEETKTIGMLKKIENKLRERDFLRDELKAIREEFSSDEMRKIIPDTAQRLKVRHLSAERIRKLVERAKCFTKG